MPDVFDQIDVQSSVSKGDVFDQLSPSGPVQKMNETLNGTIGPYNPSLLNRLRWSGLGQAVMGPAVQPEVGPVQGLVPELSQLAFGNVRPEASKGVGLLNFSPAQVLPQGQGYVGGVAKAIESQINIPNVMLMGGLGLLHGAEGTAANVLKAAAAATLAKQGAEGLGTAAGSRLNDSTLTPEQKGATDVDAATSALMMLAPTAMSPGEVPRANPALYQDANNGYVSGEMQQGTRELPFLQPPPSPRFTVGPQGDVFDQITSATQPVQERPRSEIVRPAQASPVVIGERQPQGSQILTPEMLSQSPTTVTPQYVPSRPPVGDVGGQVSFRGEGVPSARQAGEQLPYRSPEQVPEGQQPPLRRTMWDRQMPGIGGSVSYTDPQTGFTAEGFRPPQGEQPAREAVQDKAAKDLVPAVRLGSKVIEAGANEITHNDILKSAGMQESDVPVWSKDRGFVDSSGKWYSREEAAQATGLKTSVEPGKLHSEDLPRAKESGSSSTSSSSSPKLYGGLFFLDPDFWKEQVKVAGNVKMDATQLYNKIRNSLGKDSGAWKATDSEEFKRFMFSAEGGRRSTDEVREWMERNGPKVEVRKFGDKTDTKSVNRINEITHELDTLGYSVEPNDMSGEAVLLDRYGNTPDSITPRAQSLVEELRQFGPGDDDIDSVGKSHWSSIAPKAESDMPGYVEIAVVKPFKKLESKELPSNFTSMSKQERNDLQDVQFPSSHSFPPNTLGFVRGYMETTADGKKVFHVIEVQSDWAQQVRAESERYTGDIGRTKNDPLLPHYERLALKAAIDHARSEGADSIAISDAETAMMTEGHDRTANSQGPYINRQLAEVALDSHDDDENYKIVQNEYGQFFVKSKTLSQEQGMRLHYDRTLPKIAEELTGEKGNRVEFGPHKNAYDYKLDQGFNTSQLNDPMSSVIDKPRKDLIFRDPSGQPKTSISARQYDISKARENFSFYGSDKPKTPLAASPSTKLYGGLPVFDPDLWMQTASDLKEMKDKLAAHLAKKDVRGEVGAVVEAARKSTLMDSPRAAAILNNPNAKKFETLGKKFAQPGEKLSLKDQAHNAIVPIINQLNELDKIVNPWDVIFDWLDGGKAKFNGPLTGMRKEFDQKYSIEGNMHEALTSPLKKIVKDNKLRPENEQRIAVYLHSLQEGGRQRMIESGVKPSVIDNIVKTISPAERQYADAWRKLDDELYSQLREVALKADGVKLKQVANHFPWMRDFDKYTPEVDEIATNPSLKKGSTVEPDDVLWPGLPVDLGARKTPGSILSRQKNAKTPIRFDTFSIAERYIRDATHYISSRELVKDTGKLVRSDEFSDKYGDLGQKLMTEFLNTYARQGRYKKNIWIDTVKRNLGRAIIGGRIPSQLLHTANIPLAMQQAGGPVWWNRGLQASLTEEGQKFINDNFIETKMRGGGEPVQAEIAAQQARTMVGKRFNDLSRWSFAVQRELDRLNAQATTMGVYMRLLKENGKEPNDYAKLPIDSKLIGEARIRARRAVASPIYKDTPPIVARGGSLGRSFFQFQNVFLDQYSNLRYEAAQIGLPNAIRGNPRQLMTTTAALLGMLMIETSIKHGYKKGVNAVAGKKPSKDDDKFTTELVEEALKRAPGMGQLQSDLLYGGIGVPTLDVPLDTLKEGKKFLQGDRNERITSATRAAVDVGELFGMPGTSQLGDATLALERRQLYKTHDKRVSELAGKEVSSMSLQDRIKAEKSYKATEQPMSKDDQAKAAERNIANITKRGQEITKELSSSSRKWIQSKNLGDAVPGFDNKLKVGGANVYLTSEESDRLGELVKGEYEKTIAQLQTQKSEISKEVFNEQLAFARARARSVMMGELDKKGKKQSQSQSSRSDSEQDQPSRFSIIPRN